MFLTRRRILFSGGASAKSKNASNFFLYGDGSDGDVEITSTTTLVRDMYYNNLIIRSGGVLESANYRIFVKEKLILDDTAVIQNNGIDGTSESDTPVIPSGGTLSYGGAGGNGGWAPFAVSGDGDPGQSPSGWGYGASGGGGGYSDGTWAEGFGGFVILNIGLGSLSLPVAMNGVMRASLSLSPSDRAGGGAGGGGGASDFANSVAPSGGFGGGVVMIFAKKIYGSQNSFISAVGGNGGDAINGQCGGGGGGGAGAVIIYTDTSRAAFNPQILLSGGSGGAGSGVGDPGTDGNSASPLFILTGNL